MRIAITGATGFVGSHLAKFWIEHGDEVVSISRSPGNPEQSEKSGIRTITWQSLREQPGQLEGFDAIVNLAGESINQRWTKAAKTRILQSRLRAAADIADLVAKLERKPSVVVNASGISIYGPSDTEFFDESSPHRIVDFLSDVVEQWEQAADAIAGVRLVKVRVGLVLGRDGGAFPLMALPYRLFVGGRVGTGRQWMPWIHIDDMVGMIDYCIHHEDIAGPVNAAAPNPVTNREFGRTLARVLHRPNLIPVPSIAFKLLFGELSTLLLDGQRIKPAVLLERGYNFQFSELERAMRHILARK